MTVRVQGNRHQSIAARFWLHVVRGPDCWGWLGTTDPKGYGRVMHGGRHVRAHRLSWEVNRGPIPAGMQVLHSCDNPPCCNPAHLFLGTNADNVRDREIKSRRTAPAGSESSRSKLTEDAVRSIRIERSSGSTFASIASRYGVTPGAIRHIVAGRTWRNV